MFRRICCLYLDAFNISLFVLFSLSLYFCHSIDPLACSPCVLTAWNDYIYLIALLLHLLLDLLFYVWSHWLICSSIKNGWIIFFSASWHDLLIHYWIHTNEKTHQPLYTCVCVVYFGIHLNVLFHAAQPSHLLGMISCAPDHTHTPSHSEWKSLILKIHTWKTQMQTPTVKQQYLRTTMRMTNRPIVPELTDAQTLFNNKNNHCIDRTYTQIIKMKTNKQPF